MRNKALTWNPQLKLNSTQNMGILPSQNSSTVPPARSHFFVSSKHPYFASRSEASTGGSRLITSFKIQYTPRLILAARLEKKFLNACARYAANDAEDQELYRRLLTRGVVSPTYISKVNDAVGHGLFAADEIQRGEMIGEYTGVLSKNWKLSNEGGEFNPYLFKYPFAAAYAIDAREAGNELRFVNHSSKSANASRRYILHEGILRVIFVANKIIPKDRQILINYGPSYWSGATRCAKIQP